jgi:integrase
VSSLRKQGKNFFVRVSRPKGSKPQEVKIPLQTADEKTALIRKRIIDRQEREIKAGLDYELPWLNEVRSCDPKDVPMMKIIEKYLVAKSADQLRKSTIDNYRYSLSLFSEAIGPNVQLSNLNTTHIDTFKIAHAKRLSATTINISLRGVRTFLNWCFDRDYIRKVPKIKMVQVPKSEPVYLSNGQYDALCANSENHLARAWWFYRESGCRLAEPFYGEINGDFLTIKAETSKGKRTRDIYLTHRMKEILLEMRSTTHLREEVKSYKLGFKHNQQKTHEINYYSRQFCYAVRAAGIPGKHLHHLRHTAAVRTYLQTRDIYEVARKLGHASVTTTEIYTQFNIRRLEQDFPDLVQDQSYGGSMHAVAPTENSSFKRRAQ